MLLKEINENIFGFLKELNFQKAIIYIEKARKELKNNNKIDKSKIENLNNAYNIYKVMNSNREYVIQEIAKYFTNLDNEKAEFLFKIALAIDNKNHKPMSLEVGKRFIDLGEFYKKTDRKEEAKIYYEKGIIIEKNTNITGDNNYAIPLHSRSLAKIYFELNERESAIELLKKVISWYENLVNIEIDKEEIKKIKKFLAETKLQLADYYLLLDNNAALKIYSELKEWRLENENKNIIQAISLKGIGLSYELCDKYLDAINYFKKSKDMITEIFNNMHKDIEIIDNHIKNCESNYNKKKTIKKAVENKTTQKNKKKKTK